MSRSAQSGSHIPLHDGKPGIQRLPNGKRAPYWRGARAELIVGERIAQYAAAKKSRKRGSGSPRTRTPSQQLRRLERALGKRKTLAARQRIAAQIRQLRIELGINPLQPILV